MLTNGGFSVIIDDRDISAGIKFNDSDLIGIPMRVTIGPKGVKDNRVDIYIRETDERFDVNKNDVTLKCKEIETMLYRSINSD